MRCGEMGEGHQGFRAKSRGSSTPLARLTCMKVTGPATPAASPFRGKARSASGGGLHLAAQWAHWPYRAIVWSCTTQPLALAMICWRFSISGS